MPESSPKPMRLTFDDLLAKFRAARPVGSDDLIGAIRVLLEDVRDIHDRGEVADLDRVDLLGVNDVGELRLDGCPLGKPSSNDARVRAVQKPASVAVAIVRQVGVGEDLGVTSSWDRSIAEPGQEPDQPLFYRNYGSWERAIGHHDALTDIFHLGMLMGSLATGLDFRDKDQLTAVGRDHQVWATCYETLNGYLFEIGRKKTK